MYRAMALKFLHFVHTIRTGPVSFFNGLLAGLGSATTLAGDVQNAYAAS
jgi:hypothetical protein